MHPTPPPPTPRYAPSDKFPYISGMVPVFISWFLSPLLAGLVTLIIFLIIRTVVLRRANSTKIAYWVRFISARGLLAAAFGFRKFELLQPVRNPIYDGNPGGSKLVY